MNVCIHMLTSPSSMYRTHVYVSHSSFRGVPLCVYNSKKEHSRTVQLQFLRPLKISRFKYVILESSSDDLVNFVQGSTFFCVLLCIVVFVLMLSFYHLASIPQVFSITNFILVLLRKTKNKARVKNGSTGTSKTHSQHHHAVIQKSSRARGHRPPTPVKFLFTIFHVPIVLRSCPTAVKTPLLT